MTVVPQSDIERDFIEFHKTNPKVYERLRDLAREAKRIGHEKIGIDLLFARFRWEIPQRTNDPASEFKIRNDYKPYYARYLMLRHRDLRGLFIIKRLQVPEPTWADPLWEET
jgi:hypothetical protein